MSNKVWTTIVMREDNLKVFGLSFPSKFDYTSLYLLEKKEKLAEEEEESWKQMMETRLEINDRYRAFKRLDPKIVPTVLYAHNVSKQINFPSFCRTREGNILLTEECANLLKQFRLGATAMYPLSFFDLDLNEPVNDKTYYLLNIIEWRHYLIPEMSSDALRKRKIKNENYDLYDLYYPNYKDDAIAITEQAINCDLDLWHDPALTSSIFVSDALKQALDEAQLSDAWQLFLCVLK
jgi:hypothetical protein